MNWTTDKPTKPGPYWLSIEPSKRGNHSPVFGVYLHDDGDATIGAFLVDPDALDGAQWAPRETPADPFAVDTEPMFFMQDARQYVGNCVLWWRKGGGYTTEIADAELFTAARCKGMRDTDVPWDRKLVESAVCAHVRIEHLQDAKRGIAPCEHGRGAECNLAHAPTAESTAAVLAKSADVNAPSLPPWRAELERLRGLIIKPASTSPEEYQRLTQRLVALEELDALRSGVMGRDTHLLISPLVAQHMATNYVVGWPSGHWTLLGPYDAPVWGSEKDPTYSAFADRILAGIDGAGAAVLAGE